MRALTAVGILFVWILAVSIGGQTREGVAGEILRDLNTVQTKILGLAKAMPAAAWDWRPGKGVRSTGEVFMHVAADNYFMPAMMGMNAPAETKITKEYSTAETFEKRQMTREQIIAELEKSFDFLKTSLTNTPDAKLDTPPEPGRKNTTRGLWIATTTHLHEHLGQLIAYARSNNVTPPWSK
ncbi:MAG TPA: DinB family protein [Vicinamibacterales bacterium]